MLATIVHRGPDGGGSWQEGPLALGHRRLTILDTSDRASQPMVTNDGQGVLVYNGETYNYRDLRRELEAAGHNFRSSGDTEVVLCALHHWGPETAIPRLNGMFAFAYFDRRSSTLWLARDRLGIKTLVTADSGGTLLFASEAKALFAHADVSPGIDQTEMVRWLVQPYFQSQRVLFESVQSIAAGSWWKITADSVEKQSYYHLLDALDIDRLVAEDGGDALRFVNDAERLLRNSVELHLASDVPLAAMCSGGVDSSLVAAYAKDFAPGITGYVADIDFADSEGDQAERAGRSLGIPVRRVAVDQQRFLRLWADCVWHEEAPPTHRSDPALLAVTRACHDDGIKVLLTGEGSDEMFGGYGRFRTVWRKRRRLEGLWKLFSSAHRKAQFARMLAPFELPLREPLNRRLALVVDPDQESIKPRIFEHLQRIEPLSDRIFLASCMADLYGNLTSLLHRHDRLGMAASMEMRVPFIENDTIDFAIHLPRRAKLHARQGKWAVKEAAARRLPADIVYARKKGFPTPNHFTRGVERLLLGGGLADAMGWSRRATEDAVAAIEVDPDLRHITVGLEMWLRIFFAGEKVEDVGERLVALAA